MKILIITQKLDASDPILGFFHRWVEEFSKYSESLTVICLYKGEYDLPKNVTILSLGKEAGDSKIKYIINFYKYIWRERKNYDKVFVHMNQIYVLLGGIFWKILKKKIFLWYTHKSVTLSLRLAVLLSNNIFTASKESFRLNSNKIFIVGHGIDTGIFSPKGDHQTHDPYTILSVGRISSAKNQLIMTKALVILRQKGFKGRLVLVGLPITVSDEDYQKKVVEYVEKEELKNKVFFEGSSKPHLVIEAYRNADLFINLSTTGSLDKAVLEAMSCGLQIVTSNEAFKNIVPERNYCSLLPSEIAEKILILSKEKTDPALRQYVIENNNINNLIPTLIGIIKSNE